MISRGKDLGRCGLCGEPVTSNHDFYDVPDKPDVVALICPSFAEFVLDGSHAVFAADFEETTIASRNHLNRKHREL
jgi:hypothetical protein